MSQLWSRIALAVTVVVLPLSVASQAEDWSQWRGPRGDGHATVKAPLTWDADDVAWAVELPGVGQSSPIVSGDRIFLTAAKAEGAERLVLCYDRKSGEQLWQQSAWEGKPEKVHQMNPWASATCATDGEHVYAFFGIGGLHCYTVDGRHVWSRQLGEFENPWGTAASPVIVGDLVVQNCDAEDESYLAAFHKETGADAWRTPRERLRGWSTPILVEANQGPLLLLNGETGVHCYDAQSGKQMWFCKGDTGRGSPTVTPTGDGLFVVLNGRPGDMFAVRADGTEVWRTRRKSGRDLPSPIVLDGQILIVNLRPGTVTTYEAQSGKQLGSQQRLKGSFAASPIVIDGHALVPNEDGEVFVLKPGAEGAQVTHVNTIKPRAPGEVFRASLTPLDGGMLLRSTRTLYMIRK